jgi:hypothetical protein
MSPKPAGRARAGDEPNEEGRRGSSPVGPEVKSDRLDCRRLAQLAAKGLLHPVRVPTAQAFYFLAIARWMAKMSPPTLGSASSLAGGL